MAELLRAAAEHPGAIVQGRTTPNSREAEKAGALARTKRIERGPGPWFQTCNIAYPRALLEQSSGFDESFGRPFGEDVDLAWRALEGGASAHFAEEAVVEHAVEEQTAAEFVRGGLRDPDEALIFKRHPRLLAEVAVAGVFKARSHAYLAAAVAGVLLSRRSRPAAALALPYAGLLAARARALGATPGQIPLLIAYDVAETVSAAQGSLRHGVAAL